MRRHSSSTFSSEPKPHGRVWVRTAWSVFFAAVFLALFDIAVGWLFPFPSDPLNVNPPAIALYFDYGRSIEARVAEQIGPTDDTSSPLVRAAWLNTVPSPAQPAQPKTGHLLVALYGMSFTGYLSAELQKLDGTIDVRQYLGPAAPPNYSFEAFLRDRGQSQSEVVVFSILASSVRAMDSISGMGQATDKPAAFTFPKFALHGGELVKTEPLVQSLDDLRATLVDPVKKQAYRDQLYREDPFLDPFIYQESLLDHSTLARLIRRAWTKAAQNRVVARIHTEKGYSLDWEQIPVLRKMVVEFAKTVRADGKFPIVVLFQDQGFSDHLFKVLASTLEEHQIPYVSSHSLAPATDGSNFKPDGHFTDAANHRIAESVLDLIHSRK